MCMIHVEITPKTISVILKNIYYGLTTVNSTTVHIQSLQMIQLNLITVYIKDPRLNGN